MNDIDGSCVGMRVGFSTADRQAPPAKSKSAPKPGAGRFGVLNSFVDRSMRMIDPTAAAVWFVLYRDTKPNGLATASHNSIAERIGRGVRTVYSAVRQLEAVGLLTVVRRGRLNAGVSVYRVRPLVRDTGTIGNPLQKLRKQIAGIPERDHKRPTRSSRWVAGEKHPRRAAH